jgi:magnesium-protoporphyrin IX monomethyl ester (oxidative) cyclase
MDILVKKYKVNDIYLADDQFLANRERALSLLELIKNKEYNITLDAPNGISPWMLDEEIISKMSRAGFWRVPLAIESGNDFVLKNIIRKPVKLHTLPKIVDLIRKYNMQATAFFVIGSVAENAIESFDQMEDSFGLMKKLGILNPVISFITPHKGTAIYDVVKKKGYLKNNAENVYFKPKLSTPDWTADELDDFVFGESYLCRNHGKRKALLVKFFLKAIKNFKRKQRYKLFHIIVQRGIRPVAYFKRAFNINSL